MTDKFISVDTAFNTITDFAGVADTKSAYKTIWKVAKAIQKIKPADVTEVKYGKWSDKMIAYTEPSGDIHFGYKCSLCEGIYNKTKFCGGCGAKMELGE